MTVHELKMFLDKAEGQSEVVLDRGDGHPVEIVSIAVRYEYGGEDVIIEADWSSLHG